MSALTLNRRNIPSSVNIIDMPLTPPPVPTLKPINTQSPTSSTHSGSLYHNCRSVLDRLALIDGMTDYLEAQMNTTDPLTKLTTICRQGFPLWKLYNAVNPIHPLVVETDPNLNAVNSCKAVVYYFIVACRDKLSLPEEDMFSISDVYQNDTNGFVKVVHTINRLLQILEDRGIITVRSSNRNSDPNAPKNTRDKVVMELLETERKYVQDMEILQNYMRDLQTHKVLSPDTIHYLFGNLNALLDFQRRFLIQLEETAEKSPKEQRIGRLFLQAEQAFSVYEPYCANYYSAQDLVVQETPRLMKLADILDPTYQLPSLLIKPVQRICKYPLLLQELVKSTDQDWPSYPESLESVDAIKRVAEKVNETQRQHENTQTVRELKKRIDDFPLDGYGNLLLQDKLLASTSESYEREFHVFLFERSLLLCKETKGNHILPTNTLSKKKRRGSLVPKVASEAICISEVTSQCTKNVWSLELDLTSPGPNHVSIKYRNEEQFKLWSAAIAKVRAWASERHSEFLQRDYTDLYEDDDDDDDDEEDFRSRSGSFSSSSHMTRMPGMNLSPLPRSTSTFSTLSHYFPASPPPSGPSSPTARITNSHFYWSEDIPELPTEEAFSQHPLVKTGRSHSQPMAAAEPKPLPGRLRSQSNPNLLKANTVSQMMETLPLFRKPAETKPTRLGDILHSSSMKIKLQFNENIYVIVTATDISFFELMEKIKKKVYLMANLKPADMLRLKYEDEEGDLITINSDDDVQMAFESSGNTVNLFASL
ncbi:unnamed protein product [Rhizopus stolonifer]